MFKNLNVGTRLLAAFLLLASLSVLVGVIGLHNMALMDEKTDSMYERELMGLSHIKEAHVNLVYVGRAVANLMIASKQEDRDRINGQITTALQNLHRNVDAARPLFYSEKGKQTFRKFDEELKGYDVLIADLIARANQDTLEVERPVVRYLFASVRPQADTVDQLMVDLGQRKEETARAASDEANRAYESGRLYMAGVALAALVAGIAFGILVARSITTPLKQAVGLAQTVARGDLSSRVEAGSHDETGRLLAALTEMNGSLVAIVSEVRQGTDSIATASKQIAAGNLDLSARTEEQASALEQTAAAVEQLAAAVRQTSDNAESADTLADSATAVARRGGGVVDQVVDTMGAISASSARIVDITAVIEAIAFQTNILALNAAVEAARAGEQGRGFAVVAGEVRNLAQRSAAAAKEIKALIDDSAAQVASGNRLVVSAGSTMHEIVDSIARVSLIIRDISHASREQRTGIEQISQAVVEMDHVTQQNAALVEEAAAASEALKAQSAQLAGVVSRFRLDATLPAVRRPALKQGAVAVLGHG